MQPSGILHTVTSNTNKKKDCTIWIDVADIESSDYIKYKPKLRDLLFTVKFKNHNRLYDTKPLWVDVDRLISTGSGGQGNVRSPSWCVANSRWEGAADAREPSRRGSY